MEALYIIFMMAVVGGTTYFAIMCFPTVTAKREELFAPIPVPVEKKEFTVKVKHDHYHHKYTSFEEGQEVSRKLPDGSIVSIRKVRRWK